jgi:hypothetical protein
MNIQTFFNSNGTSLTAVITILVDGVHTDPDSWPISNDPAIVLSSHASAAKTVTKIDDGVYQVVWSGLSAALTHGQVVYISVDGAISSEAWSTWVIPVQVVYLPPMPSANSQQIATDVAGLGNGWDDAIRAIVDDGGIALESTAQQIAAQTDQLQFDGDGNVLANAVAGSGAFSVSVLPAIGITADRSPGVSLKAFTGETITQSITLYQTDGVTPVVLTGKTLVIVFETRQGVDVATVASGNITISGDDDNVVTFAYPAAATTKERVLTFAIRDAGSPEAVYLQGLLKVTRAPRVDPVEP